MRATPFILATVCCLTEACSPSVPAESAPPSSPASSTNEQNKDAEAAAASRDKPSELKDQESVAAPAATAPTDKAAASGGEEEPAAPPQPSTIPAPEDVAAPPANAQRTASGLAWVVLTQGTGKTHPLPQDRVTVHYTGWTEDGAMIDSSVVRGHPASFGVSGLIKGWTEGLQLMTKGATYRFWIPAELAYGKTPGRGRLYGPLTYDIELIDIATPPKVPLDVAAPSAGSTTTASGLAYKILEPGNAKGKTPDAASRVTVHYTGWTQDGKMFDSSIVRERPASFAVRGVIKGWTEGLQLMKEGATYRFWIPAELAYGNSQNSQAPSGQLTFDVQLISVQ